jgi:hypothetical protein
MRGEELRKVDSGAIANCDLPVLAVYATEILYCHGLHLQEPSYLQSEVAGKQIEVRYQDTDDTGTALYSSYSDQSKPRGSGVLRSSLI